MYMYIVGDGPTWLDLMTTWGQKRADKLHETERKTVIPGQEKIEWEKIHLILLREETR